MPYEKRNILLLTICQICSVSSTIIMVTFSGFVGQILSSKIIYATLPIAIAVLGAAFCAVPVSMLMKRYGRKMIFRFGSLLGFMSGLIACIAIYQMNFILFCFATLLHGGFQAVASFYRFAALEVSQGKMHEKAVSYVLTGGLVAAFLGSTIALTLNDVVAPGTYMGAYVAVMIFTLGTQIPLSFLKFPPREKEVLTVKDVPKVKAMTILKRPIFLCASLNAAGGYLLMSFVMTASPLAIKGCGFGIDSAAHAIQWHSVAMFLPAFFTGHLIKKFGPMKIISIGLFFMAVTASINLYAEELLNFYLGLIFVGVGWNFMFTAGTTWVASSYQPHEKALAQGMNDFIVYGMTALASFSAGIIFAEFGWARLNMVVFVIIAALILNMIILLSYNKRKIMAA